MSSDLIDRDTAGEGNTLLSPLLVVYKSQFTDHLLIGALAQSQDTGSNLELSKSGLEDFISNDTGILVLINDSRGL